MRGRIFNIVSNSLKEPASKCPIFALDHLYCTLLIARRAGGYDHVDLEGCSRRNESSQCIRARRGWREEVSRLYYRLLLEDERRVTIYNNLISLDWHQQEY